MVQVKFTAVKRKKVVSYHISNIDIDVLKISEKFTSIYVKKEFNVQMSGYITTEKRHQPE